MRVFLPALLLLLAAQAGAQSFISMGRLFTTPSERAQLDAQRSQAPAGTGAAAAGGAGSLVPGMPAGPGGAAGAGLAAAAGAGAAAAPGAEGAGGAQDARGELLLGGIVRRSNGRAMVIVNGEVTPAPAGSVQRGGVRLDADGRSIILKPGQRYDPATGEIHEAAR